MPVVTTLLICVASIGILHDVPVPEGVAFASTWDKVNFAHDLWSGVLADHVDDAGLVNYGAIRDDRRFAEYLHRLAKTPLEKLPDDDARLAFWINAYNAFAIQGVLRTLPENEADWRRYNVLEIKIPGGEEGFFRGLRFMAGGRRYSLDDIEKGILLHRADFIDRDRAHYLNVGLRAPDPRVHFALVCAAKGCVKLHGQAYRAASIERQLDDAVRRFVSDPRHASFDRKNRTARLSKIVEWYADDLTNPAFVHHAKTVTGFLARFVEDGDLARSLTRDKWRIIHTAYDWTLNLQP